MLFTYEQNQYFVLAIGNVIEEELEMAKKMDRRVERMKNLIQEALISLMLEQSYESITVQEIIDRANVGRATFYKHFENKEDLLLRGIAHIPYHANAQTHLGDPDSTESHPHRPVSGKKTLSFAASFIHSKNNQRLHEVMYRRSFANPILDKVTSFFYERINTQLKQLSPPQSVDDVKVTVLSHFLTGGLLAVIKWWQLSDFPYSVDEMDEFVQAIVNPSLAAVLDDE